MNQEAPYYRLHVFHCTNERPPGHARGCCKGRGGEDIRNYMKARVKEEGIDGIRVNAAGCLDRCAQGPVVVVYPEGIWYRCPTRADADEIIESHFKKGQPVTRLQLHNQDPE